MSSIPTVIEFFAPVDDRSIKALLAAINQKMANGAQEFILLLSTPGGSVFHGLSAYNFLKGMPADIVTHNFGSVDSIGIVLMCAGKRRLSVPQARFMLHGVSAQFLQGTSLEEKQLEERLKGLRSDLENLSKIIAANSGKSMEAVMQALLDRTTLTPEEAKEWGLIHEIQSELFPAGAEIIQIH